MMHFVLSYCILFCQVWLLSLETCSFLKGQGELTSRGEGDCGGAGKSGVKRNWSGCVVQESIFNFFKRINQCEKLIDVSYSQFNLKINAARIKIPL